MKRCEDWNLLYGEYHLHDKYGRAIRISRKKSTPEPAGFQSAVTATPLVTATTQTITVYRTVTNLYEENIFSSHPLLWILLVLLLLLLILLRTRRENPKTE